MLNQPDLNMATIARVQREAEEAWEGRQAEDTCPYPDGSSECYIWLDIYRMLKYSLESGNW